MSLLARVTFVSLDDRVTFPAVAFAATVLLGKVLLTESIVTLGKVLVTFVLLSMVTFVPIFVVAVEFSAGRKPILGLFIIFSASLNSSSRVIESKSGISRPVSAALGAVVVVVGGGVVLFVSVLLTTSVSVTHTVVFTTLSAVTFLLSLVKVETISQGIFNVSILL